LKDISKARKRDDNVRRVTRNWASREGKKKHRKSS